MSTTPINLFAQGPVGSEKLNTFFITHLNRIYCAKSHLVERFPEIYDQASFNDLKLAINETREDVEKQIVRMDQIYVLLNATRSLALCKGLIGLVEEAFTAIHNEPDDLVLRDLSILFYLHNIESVEETSFQILTLVALQLKNKQVTQLLRENYDEAKEDKALLLLINTKYITGKA